MSTTVLMAIPRATIRASAASLLMARNDIRSFQCILSSTSRMIFHNPIIDSAFEREAGWLYQSLLGQSMAYEGVRKSSILRRLRRGRYRPGSQIHPASLGRVAIRE